jgi:DNA-binding IclR family transcriptional regulator
VALDLIEQVQLRVGEPATMSELARAIGKNTATCHTVLRMLEARGYVSQDAETRRYTIGPDLLSLGAAIARRIDLLSLAEGRLRSLCAELGVPGTVLRSLGNGAVQMVRRIDQPAGFAWQMPENRANPFPNLVNLVLLAWEDADEVARIYRAWLPTEGAPPYLRSLAAYEAELKSVRRVGYIEKPFQPRIPELLISVTAATVFDSGARPVLALALYSLTSAREPVHRYHGRALRAVADAVTQSICGRTPEDYPSPEAASLNSAAPPVLGPGRGSGPGSAPAS